MAQGAGVKRQSSALEDEDATQTAEQPTVHRAQFFRQRRHFHESGIVHLHCALHFVSAFREK